ncbi:Outer membrane efflux protein [Botrimarina colliarenosi]|uniref:Outer membrane efflux protein n=2 Tax=Botrimarina colliarenosi TaxID=2528001 RepID=A0A5C6AJD7_9BACT|nr:Outer membrane efflux protein [Botrimarina colliarenosi]
MASLEGCSRSKARLRADRDAYHLLDQKSTVAGGDIGAYRIGIDPRSRMYDNDSPDCPPMPPDDPTSHHYMVSVDGKKGAKYWREAPRTPWVDPPDWRATLPVDAQGRLVLDSTAAVRLGLVNDPDFQNELEELYLSALDVSFERFRFDTQLFGGSGIEYVADGRVRSGTGESSSQLYVSPSNSTLGPGPANRWRLQKLTATGGEMVVGLANTLVWQFAGGNDYSSRTLLDFSIVQPLLRGGGRVRILERLTVAERALLANVRSMERFRGEYYLNVAVGRFLSGGPQRRGGLLGGAGLSGFAGVNLQVGNFGGGNFGGGNGNSGVAGAAAAGGYLGLLQTQKVLSNQRANVAALRDSTMQLAASYDAGRIDRFQVDLARQALFNAQSQLLRAEADFQTSLDNFKVDLGLPPDIELVIADPLLEPFNLLSPEVTALQNDVADVLLTTVDPVEAVENQVDTALDATPVPDAEPVDPLAGPTLPTPDGPTLSESVPEEVPAEAGETVESDRLLAEAAAQFAVVESDLQTLLNVVPARREHLLAIRDRSEVVNAQIDRALFDPDLLDERVASIEVDVAAWRDSLATLQAEFVEADAAERPKLLRRLSAMLLELSILQARTRLDALDLTPMELTPQEALEIARVNRRDWANARASLVDAWRLIHFNANNLMSAVDLVFSGDLANVGDNPLRFRDTNGRLRVGVEFDSPTSRLAERNVYRQSLIEYQQARRSYYQFVDRIYQSLRGTLRQIRLNEVNFELRREAVLVAIAQVDLTQLRLSEPPKPGATEQFNNTTARDLVQALGDLLNAQNDLLSVWVNNRVQRLNLELDLGVMLVDSQGLRVEMGDDFDMFVPRCPCPGGGDVSPLPLAGPCLLPPDLAQELQTDADGSPNELMKGELANPMGPAPAEETRELTQIDATISPSQLGD